MPISSLKKFINTSTVIYIIRSFRQSRSNSQILSFFTPFCEKIFKTVHNICQNSAFKQAKLRIDKEKIDSFRDIYLHFTNQVSYFFRRIR